MRITEYISEDLVIAGMPPCSKTEALSMMVDRLISAGKLAADRKEILLSKLMEREALSSTGIGGGVAIPHASGENVENMILAVGQSPEGVEFESLDGQPVKVIFLIVGSERAPRSHLQMLAMIVRVCKGRDLIKSLAEAHGSGEIFRLLSVVDGK